MSTDDPLTRSQQQRMTLWLRGCVLIGAIGLVIAVVLSVELYITHRSPFLDVRPERINPNNASVASLVRLPGVGKARALDIIQYRQANAAEGLVFRTPHDLEQIRGIGPKTAEIISPWLTFEEE